MALHWRLSVPLPPYLHPPEVAVATVDEDNDWTVENDVAQWRRDRTAIYLRERAAFVIDTREADRYNPDPRCPWADAILRTVPGSSMVDAPDPPEVLRDRVY